MPPGFSPHELAKRYDVESFCEDEWHAYCGRRTSHIIASQLSLRQLPSNRLLNAGSGVHQITATGWVETSVDLFDAPIRGHKNAVCASVENLPFEAGTFGAVICVGEVLGYCDPAKAIREFARVLVPSGILVCDFGNSRSFRYLLKRTYGRAADMVTDHYNNNLERIWVYDHNYILSLVKSAHFRTTSTFGTHTWSALAHRFGFSMQSATSIQHHLEWFKLPTKWADVTTIVSVQDAAARALP